MEEIYCISKEDARYPKRMRKLEDMPEKLYYKGKLPEDDQPTAAIVGARMCSPYGRIQAFRYAKFLSEAGIQIISGLAHGVDVQAHQGALEGNTPTFAVMGNSPEICYPAANKRSYDRILRNNGGILSEYPPGTKGSPWHFPRRNRIISALADLILIVEAKEGSGSLITASHALEQGKQVYAIPGQVQDELSRGCHKLIYDGAGIAYSPEVLLSEWGIQKPKQYSFVWEQTMTEEMRKVYECLDLHAKGLNELGSVTGIPPARLNALLLEMELSGLVMEVGRQHYVKKEKR